MKTKHMQYRSALFIGLLSLNTLSSCVNTTRRLGGGGSSRDTEQGNNTDRSRKENSNWKQKAAWGVTTAAVTTAAVYSGYSYGKADGYAKGLSDGKSGCFNGPSSNSNNTKPPGRFGSDRP
ncbi:hypothetical protein [Cardinium endosymbiont of Philonthus spinipes]|uniref:hypothetical protein n=1 Tax=Cardinium endosymbiont of Philonthus spinipes TaxID=3077941 RepID=UPI00313B8A0F